MLINSLEQMEKIVAKNYSLSWDGWDVVQSFKDPVAWKNKNAAYIKGKWYSQRRFELSSKGWEIPNKLLG